MNEDKSTRYRRLQRRVYVLHAASAVVLLGLCASLAPRLPLAGRPVLQDVLTFVAVGGLLAMVSAPWAWIEAVLLARRYGGSDDASPWTRRHIWQWALSIAAALPVWLIFQWLQRVQPWLAAAGTTLVIVAGSLAMLAIAPTLILWSPRVTALGDEALTGRLHALVGRAGLRIGGLHAWRDGPYAAEPNAALLGAGPGRRLLLSDALIAQFAPEDIDIVVAHELGHHARGHIWRRLRLSWVVVAAAATAAQASMLVRGLLLDTPAADPRGLPWCLLAIGAVVLAARPRMLALSRLHEIEADEFALRVTGRPDLLERVLARIGTHYRAAPDPSPFESAFFLTHPPVRERVARARAWRAGA